MPFTYQREETAINHLEVGEYRVVVVSAENATSKNTGKEMIKIGVKPSGADMTLYNYLVEGEYFNRNLTQFYDSFDVPEGNLNLVEWIGAEGAAKLGKDKEGYLKIKWFINKNKAASLPPFVGSKPEKQEITSFSNDDDPFEDLL